MYTISNNFKLITKDGITFKIFKITKRGNKATAKISTLQFRIGTCRLHSLLVPHYKVTLCIKDMSINLKNYQDIFK